MILYHAVSTYQLLHCMVHKKVYHKNDKSHLIISSFILNKFPNFKQLKGEFFDEVKVYDELVLGMSCSDNIEIKQGIIDTFDVFLKNEALDLNSYSSIYVCCAHGYFGKYLALKNMKFIFIEDASGILSRPHIIEEIEKNLSLPLYELSKELNLFNGENENIISCICNLNTQESGFTRQNAKHFDVVSELSKLNQEFIDRVLQFFNVSKKYKVNNESILVLTQHFANLNIMSYEQQKSVYTLVYDYLLENKQVFFKAHPDDVMHYPLMFPNSVLIEEKFPSELISFIFDNVPSSVLTITSTAINNIKSQFMNSYRFGYSFEKNFELIHSYYCLLKVISELNLDRPIYELNTSDYLLDNLVQLSDIQNLEINKVSKINDIQSNSIIFIDDNNVDMIEESIKIQNFLENLDEDSIVVFLNSTKKYIFYNFLNKEVIENLTAIEVKISDLSHVGINEVKSQVVYVYSKKSEVRKMITEVKVEKNLSTSEKSVKVEPNSDYKIENLVLKGVLEATEKRLKYYINREKELLKLINGGK